MSSEGSRGQGGQGRQGSVKLPGNTLHSLEQIEDTIVEGIIKKDTWLTSKYHIVLHVSIHRSNGHILQVKQQSHWINKLPSMEEED